MDLKTLNIGSTNLKCMIIGDISTGKSTFASTFPQPIKVLDWDRGALSYEGIEGDASQYTSDLMGWSTFTREVISLKKENPFKTVVLDSMTFASDACMQATLTEIPTKNVPKGLPEKGHYAVLKNKLMGVIRNLVTLDCNIVIICHTQVLKDEATGRLLVVPNLVGKLQKTLPGLFDEVYYSSVKDTEGKKEYLLQTAIDGYYNARSRLSKRDKLLPLFIQNDYKVLMSEYQKLK